MKKRKRKVFVATALLLSPMVLSAYLFIGFRTTSSKHDCGKSVTPSLSTNDKTSSSMASDSDWTYDGSTANRNARKVFDAWVNKGLSGGSASGIVGWVNSEGGFAMIGRAEGHYGNDIKTNSIAYGVVPIGLAYYTFEAGGGSYQITPYTKYAPLGSPDWEDADKMNEFVGKAISNGDWNAAMDMSGKNRTFRQMAEETDPQSATLAWQAYERGSVAHINVEQKKADAQKAYDMFDGGKYKFNEEVFNQHFGNSPTASSEKSTNSSNSSKSKGACGSSRTRKSSGLGHLFDEPYTVIQAYGFTPWSMSRPDMYPNGKHTGVDLNTVNNSDFMTRNIPVYAMSDGKVTEVTQPALAAFNGEYLIHTTPDGGFAYYGHLRDFPLAKLGEDIKKGDLIGYLGNTGSARFTPPHVHFEYKPTMAWHTLDGKSDDDPSFLFKPSGTLELGEVIDPSKDPAGNKKENKTDKEEKK